MIRTLTFAVVALTLGVPMARAQQGTVPAPPAQEGVAPAAGAEEITAPAAARTGEDVQAAVNDALFAQAAAIGGLAELSLSQLGVQKATDPDLKRFSQQMIEDHTQMNRALMTLAGQRGIALPAAVDPRAQFCAQSLAGLSGDKFDRCYAKAQLVAHMDAVATFEAEAERGQDPAVKALAARALPRIKDHLKMVKPIADRYEQEQPSTSGAASERHEDE